MKNKDKFKEKIWEIACAGDYLALNKETNELCPCSALTCSNCDFASGDGGCSEKAMQWCESEYMEEPDVDWSKVPVDTPILVRMNCEMNWVVRHFAKYFDNKIYAWNNGMTSHTIKDASAWEYAKLSDGVKIDEDVCEWSVIKTPMNFTTFRTSCGKIRLQCATGVDIYCNGCGKKIKIVGD